MSYTTQLAAKPSRRSVWKTFTENRVAEIGSFKKSIIYTWHCVNYKANPDDLISTSIVLLKFRLTGSLWFKPSSTEWPHPLLSLKHINVTKKREILAVVFVRIIPEFIVFEKVTIYLKLQWMTLIRRYILCNCKNKAHRKAGNLTFNELDDATKARTVRW